MAKNDLLAVWFNKEAQQLHSELIKKNLTSQPFKEFVKTAFHDKVDKVRDKLDLSVEKIREITMEQISKLTSKTP